MGETIAVLVVFFILLAIAMMFFGGIQRTTIQQEIEENIDKKAIEIAQKVTFMPELQCSFEEVIKENCFDVYKVEALTLLTEQDQPFLFYRKDFGISRITVEQVYPHEKTWLVFNNTPLNFTTSISAFIPLSLLNSSIHPKRYSFGFLNVTMYS